ncbi:MAG: hypothetical protein ACKO3R_02065, partial [bacterium]
MQNLSRAQHTPRNIPVPSGINLDLCTDDKTAPREQSTLKKAPKRIRPAGFGSSGGTLSSQNKTEIDETQTTPKIYPASQSPSYTDYLDTISTQRDDSIANNKILHIENSATIKSNIEANRRLLWRTLVQDPALKKLAQDTLVEYLNARPDDKKLIKFTFPAEEGSTRRITKELSLGSIQKLENDPDILMLVLLAKARKSPKEKITEDLNLEDIIQIVDHMACISAWKNDSKEAKYPPDEPELRQILDLSIRSTQVQEHKTQKPDEVFPEITTVLSPEILEEKKDTEGNTYEVVIPLEEMFEKPSIINPNNLNKIAKAFKDFSGLDLAKDKLLDIYSVPIDPVRPQWLSSNYIRIYPDLGNASVKQIAYTEPRLSDTRRPDNIISRKEDEAASGQKLSSVNNYTSAVLEENIADAQKALSDLFNPDPSTQNTPVADACKSFETQYPIISQNPLLLINDDKYCNSGVIQYLCFKGRFDEASEAFKSAMPKLKNAEDKEFLKNVVLSLATNSDNLTIKLCVL